MDANEKRREAGLKAAARIKAERGEDFYKTIGAKGGMAKSPLKGFGSMSLEQHKAVSAKGGAISRRRAS